MGYSGLYKAKPDSTCLKMAINIGPDGCAIFFDKKRFQAVENGDEVI